MESSHLVTGLELERLLELKRKRFDPQNTIFTDARATVFVNALENTAASQRSVECEAKDLEAPLDMQLKQARDAASSGADRAKDTLESVVMSFCLTILSNLQCFWCGHFHNQNLGGGEEYYGYCVSNYRKYPEQTRLKTRRLTII